MLRCNSKSINVRSINDPVSGRKGACSLKVKRFAV